MKTVNILLCDTFPGLLPDFVKSYEDMFMKLFNSVADGLKFNVFLTLNGELPQELHNDELYVITGSNNGACQDIEWINKLKQWIIKAVAAKTRILGVCFGHQVIAEALGGKVIKFPGGFGTGIRTSKIITPEAKKYYTKGEVNLLYLHHDQVVELPKDAVCFLTDDFCKYGGFTIGDHVVTYQGHPEFEIPYVRHILTNHSQNEDPEVLKKAFESFESGKQLDGTIAATWALNLK
ncbi:glutamine amidotransferase class-I family protein [Trichomonas vaginalis G3]|uniref:Glutamine amidotransferase class-I family protein n=1 Tax=Trichomonas vaginalis (strain ATCC PRA-98 / G3) TaxID=412133 RepID=A2F9G2_TRIV3|nr:peptidase protein [Trichomonas vaginalis G3]EAX98481.1 glutamine amidotransferase class-I family protein [Trichomonas vaginalis G3]KAI5492764.1 peptidase protein [Trichomonas vaginalis G3]|eukprot:XP_001311411.1 glutamine amidotransferase class-I family protein [Trichomonas vaginalis G3]